MQGIEPIPGELFRFHVRSFTERGLVHLVDLQANRLNGWCSCDDFQARRGPALRHNEGQPGDVSRCKHILAVRDWLLNRFLVELARQSNQPEEKIS